MPANRGLPFAFIDDDRSRLIVDDQHAGNPGLFGSGASQRIHGVVRTERDPLDSFHRRVGRPSRAIRRRIGFGQQDVHVSGHSTRNRSESRVDGDLLRLKLLTKVADRVLRYEDSNHPVTRHDDDTAGDFPTCRLVGSC